MTVTELALKAYERALELKRLVLIPGGHFDPYLDQFPRAEAAATAWFREHLVGLGISGSRPVFFPTATLAVAKSATSNSSKL